jgi:hypothetical protein
MEVNMNAHEVSMLESRFERRKDISLEERQVEALEDIADALIGLVDRLDRIGDNVVG